MSITHEPVKDPTIFKSGWMQCTCGHMHPLNGGHVIVNKGLHGDVARDLEEKNGTLVFAKHVTA